MAENDTTDDPETTVLHAPLPEPVHDALAAEKGRLRWPEYLTALAAAVEAGHVPRDAPDAAGDAGPPTDRRIEAADVQRCYEAARAALDGADGTADQPAAADGGPSADAAAWDEHLSDAERAAVEDVLADGTRVFYGTDETARRGMLFGYVLEPTAPVPLPETAQEALDLLKPAPVVKALRDPGTDDDRVSRQGDIWLTDVDFVDTEPAGGWYKPGIGERPFGASPLGNHVPREYAFMKDDEAFLQAVADELAPPGRFNFETPKDVVETVWHQQQLAAQDGIDVSWSPEVERLIDVGGGLAVRGTLRHRNKDHFMETVGDGDEPWRAFTQGVDFSIYTAGELDTLTSPTTEVVGEVSVSCRGANWWHIEQSGAKFSPVSSPPRAAGTMWCVSILVAAPEYPHFRQVSLMPYQHFPKVSVLGFWDIMAAHHCRITPSFFDSQN